MNGKGHVPGRRGSRELDRCNRLLLGRGDGNSLASVPAFRFALLERDRPGVVLAVQAFAFFSAEDQRLETLAILLEALGLLAVAPTRVFGATLPSLFNLGLECVRVLLQGRLPRVLPFCFMLQIVVAVFAVAAIAVDAACKTVTVQLEAFGILAVARLSPGRRFPGRCRKNTPRTASGASSSEAWLRRLVMQEVFVLWRRLEQRVLQLGTGELAPGEVRG